MFFMLVNRISFFTYFALMGVCSSVGAAFDSVAVGQKIEAFKQQLNALKVSKQTVLDKKSAVDQAVVPYAAVTNSTAINLGKTQSSFAAGCEASSQQVMAFEAKFDAAYIAHVSYFSNQVTESLKSALSEFTAAIEHSKSMFSLLKTAQNFFKEEVAGVDKPAFIVS